MEMAFVSCAPLTLRATTRKRVALRQSGVRRCARRQHVTMMPKFQEADKSGTEAEDETPTFVPPIQLPTLSTLSGLTAPEADDEKKDGENEPMMAQMGMSSLSAEEEFRAIVFLREAIEELKTVDWPPLPRVFKIMLIIIISIIFSSFAIYTVDGFFSYMASQLFEINL